MDVGPAELLIVLVIALVIFGGAKLPELARGLGSAKKEYEKGLRGDDAPTEAAPATPAPPAALSTGSVDTATDRVGAAETVTGADVVDTTGTAAHPDPAQP